MMRASGILCPVSSLPSLYGIGTFGREAYRFIDFLKASGQKYWQILPLGQTGYGDSPYQSVSTFAGNPYLIDLELLCERGVLTQAECRQCDFGNEDDSVNYQKLADSRYQLLYTAFQRDSVKEEKAYRKFIKKQSFWLDDYALYMALKAEFGQRPWMEWDEKIKRRKLKAMAYYREKCDVAISFYYYLQFLFWKQWKSLKKYANQNGIQIIGDIPIYVALDSADAWSNQPLFQFDPDGLPTKVAGCPPDAFSETGQLWGNPVYDWKYHQKTEYDWWVQRIRHCFELYDVVRIDHFRGFDEYYAIPYGHKTAEKGQWEKGPGYDLFRVLKKKLGKLSIIAEDLGFLTDTVRELLDKTGYPGMKVLQFAFDSREESDYLPYRYPHNCVVYTGTHDNNTTRGWFSDLSEEDLKFAKRYMHLPSQEESWCWEMIRLAMSSVADLAVIPIQDYLNLGSQARMNTPSTVGENWKWRLKPGQYNAALAKRITELTQLYGR
jgi:4-alpha-glucanotransferase